MKLSNKKIIPVIILIGILFTISYLFRRSRDNDIIQNKMYTFARIVKRVGSLKNGNEWFYEFIYKNKVYESFRSTHIGYDVRIGDYYLVQFSYKNPAHNRILYQYQLKPEMIDFRNYIGDSIPITIVKYNEKKDRFW